FARSIDLAPHGGMAYTSSLIATVFAVIACSAGHKDAWMAGREERPVPAPHFRSDSRSTQRRATDDGVLIEAVAEGKERTCQWLLARQHEDGYWCGELEGDTILESEYILLLAWLGDDQNPLAKKLAA